MNYAQDLHSISLLYEYLFPCLIHNSGFYLVIQLDLPSPLFQTAEER